jgi:antitoxin component of RelBE/YafQ-DinJ toxin-antitoxin module
MTIAEVIPIVESLPHADKFKLIQFLLEQLANEEGFPLQTRIHGKKDSLWDIVGMAEGEDADVARRHDEYLYCVK